VGSKYHPAAGDPSLVAAPSSEEVGPWFGALAPFPVADESVPSQLTRGSGSMLSGAFTGGLPSGQMAKRRDVSRCVVSGSPPLETFTKSGNVELTLSDGVEVRIGHWTCPDHGSSTTGIVGQHEFSCFAIVVSCLRAEGVERKICGKAPEKP